MTKPAIGFVGLGNMGRPMIRHIALAGYGISAYDRDPVAIASVSAIEGVVAAVSVAEVAARSDIVITMLPNSDIVRAVATGPDGLASKMDGGGLVIDMSSSFPPDTQQLGEYLQERGLSLIDAPVSGGVARAVTGELAIMVGGDEAAVARGTPVLETMGKIYPAGALGAGHALKALNNYVSAAGLAAACEAIIIAECFGIDGQTAVEIFNGSSGRNNATETKMRQFVLSGKFGSGFTANLMAKDVRAAAQLASDLGLTAPLLDLSAGLWTDAANSLGAGADHTAIYTHLRSLTRDNQA
jgi:3-hydroxyisobutyrate dehydrogenase